METASSDASGDARADVIWGVLIAVGAGFLLWLAYQPREVTIFSQADNMFWPRHILWPLFFCSLLLAGRGVVRMRFDGSRTPINPRVFLRPLILSSVCVAYFLLIDVIGFVFATFLFAGSALVVLGRHSPKVMAAFATVTTLVVYAVFLKGVSAPLPRGIGVFRDLSFLLY